MTHAARARFGLSLLLLAVAGCSQPEPQQASMPAPPAPPGPTMAACSQIGLASWYRGTARNRASPQELTAAHPSLPFGSSVRVTAIDTGQSIIVRINDRGPFGRARIDLTYNTLSYEANGAWDWKHKSDRSYGFPGSPNVEPDLVEALVTNPHLHVEVENGIYDLATPFLATEYTMTHLNLPENLQKNIKLQYYDAGHMMYLREADLAKLKANIANFLDAATRQ